MVNNTLENCKSSSALSKYYDSNIDNLNLTNYENYWKINMMICLGKQSTGY